MPENNHYLKRVVPEHRRPKFMKWLDKNLSPVNDIENLLKELDTAFDLDQSCGVQLDITGTVVGRDRMLTFEPPMGLSPVLDDALYRILQRAKISMNQWDGTIPGMYALWDNLFPELDIVVEDHQDMSMNVYILGDTFLLERELMSRGYITPKPEGVRINYKFILPELLFNKTIYIGSAMTADFSKDFILSKCLANMEFDNTSVLGSALTIDYSRMVICSKVLPDTIYTSMVSIDTTVMLDYARMYVKSKTL